MSDDPVLEVPPEDVPDEGMGTARDDWEARPEVDPQVDDDFGMSAGYPIITDDAIPMDPGEPPDEIEPPPEEAMQGAPLFSPEALAEPGPDSGAAPKPAEPFEASDELLNALVTKKALKDLWQRADQAQEQVQKRVKALGIARELHNLIQAARNEILAGKDHYEEAERFINEVEYRVELSGKMVEWTKRYGLPLFVYEVVWAVISFAIMFYWMNWAGYSTFQEGGTDLVYFIGCMMWGGIGGVIGALISLVKHIAIEQDFDRQHMLWYISSPIIGYGVGAVIFLVLRAGLISLTGPDQAITSPFVMYVIAWLSGYQHNVFTDILKRILKIFEVGSDEKKQ